MNDRKYDRRGEAGPYFEPLQPLSPIIYDLRRRRYDMGVSQSALAKRFGVSRRTLNNWETGVCLPTRKNLAKWADALGMKIDFATLDPATLSHGPKPPKDPDAPVQRGRPAGWTASTWTKEMDELLRDKWTKMSLHNIAKLLSKSVRSMRRRAETLGLTQGQREAAITIWTQERVALVRELWPTHSVPQIAEALNMTVVAVSHKVRKMDDLPAKRPRGPYRKKYRPRVKIDMPQPLGQLEYAPGHFAADQRSYEIIQAVRAAA